MRLKITEAKNMTRKVSFTEVSVSRPKREASTAGRVKRIAAFPLLLETSLMTRVNGVWGPTESS